MNATSSPANDTSSERCESEPGISTDKPAEGKHVSQTPSTMLQKKSKSNADHMNKNGKQKLPPIGPGKGCKIKRKHDVYQSLEVGAVVHKLVDSFDSKEFNFYGNCISKQHHGIWRVALDLLPMSASEVLA